MERVLVFFLVNVFLFRIVESANPIARGSVSSDMNLQKYYEISAKKLVSDPLNGMLWCKISFNGEQF